MTEYLGPNTHLIGTEDGLHNLFTPALVIELEPFERNIARMAAFCKERGIGFRPHAKTHKSVEIAKRQIASGALGVCCATLGEAEALTAGGIENILITTPAVGAHKIERFFSLHGKTRGMMIVLDTIDQTRQFAEMAETAKASIDVLIALDIGTHRIGAPVGVALEIAKIAQKSSALNVRGIHAYSGFLQHIHDYEERKARVAEANEIVKALIEAFHGEGISSEIVSGVGTGSHQLDVNHGTFTEMQVGSYIFMDVEYNDIDWPEGSYEQSLFVMTTVISNNHPGFVTTDGGTKRFSMGSVPPRFVDQDHWKYEFQGDEHGKIVYGDHNDIPQFGEFIKVVPPHCDPTVNLYDFYHVIDNGKLVDIWPIEARGAF